MSGLSREIDSGEDTVKGLVRLGVCCERTVRIVGITAPRCPSEPCLDMLGHRVWDHGILLFFCSFQSAIKGLTMGGLEVISITDNTPIPHNGCRPRKARRL